MIDAVTHEDFDKLRELAAKHPEVLVDGNRAGWSEPMAAAANIGARRVIETLRVEGARSVSAAMARPALHKWLDTFERSPEWADARTVTHSADQSSSSRATTLHSWVELGLGIGAPGEPSRPDNPEDWRGDCAMVLETYSRSPADKHRILEVMAHQGIPLPDSPAMAVHRGRVDLLETHLERDADLLNRPVSAATKIETSRCTVRRCTVPRSSIWRSSTKSWRWRVG